MRRSVRLRRKGDGIVSSPSSYEPCDAPDAPLDRGGQGVAVGVLVAVATGSKVPAGVGVEVGVKVAGIWMTSKYTTLLSRYSPLSA